MSPEEYMKETERTAKNDHYHGNRVYADVITTELMGFVEHGEFLDQIKRAIYYGKEYDFCSWWIKDSFIPPISSLLKDSTDYEKLHAILGIATESAELVDSLVSAEGVPSELDQTNVKEEIGDILWYIALLLRQYNWSFEEVMDLNIAKLRKRYPEKFTQENAINRNLEEERTILEGS